jgi:Carbon dioxide concentrating mechanism/carboxysome shell protein
MGNAIGVIESANIAKGIELCDQMVKASIVSIIDALPMCPGKFVIIIGGSVADVENSVRLAEKNAGSNLIDSLVIPNIDEQVFKSINSANNIGKIEALGIIETFSVASGISAADTAVKAASVDLIEVRLSRGMGGKAFITLTGTVANVGAAVKAGCDAVGNDGLLAGYSVIPSPDESLKRFII